MKESNTNPSKIIIKKRISFSKKFSSYATIFFIIIICFNFIGLLYSIDTITGLKNEISKLDERIEIIEDNNSNLYFENTDNDINNYYRELSDKTDDAIDRILTIVGVLATIITVFGVLLAFKAPRDIEKRMEENNALLNKAEKAAEEAKYQSEIIEALNIDYDGKLTNPKRIQQISKVIKKYPERPEAYMHRGFLYDQMAQKTYGAKKKVFLNLAISDYEIARNLDIDMSSYYNDMGVVYSRLHEYNKAISYYSKAIKEDPEDTAAYTNRGGDYESIGEYEKSLEDFEKALELNPDCYDAFIGRSYTYQSLWRRETNPEQRDEYIRLQIADLERAIEINIEDIKPQELLKNLLDELKEKKLLDRFGYYEITKEDLEERIGDRKKEEREYAEAVIQYSNAIISHIKCYIIFEDINAKNAIIRIISKIYAIYISVIIAEKDKIDAMITKFCEITRGLPTLLYKDGAKEATEKLLILLLNYDNDNNNNALNLAFMKRRNETKYTDRKALELLNICSDQQSAIWCMNKALCYVDGIDVEKNWYAAIEIINSSEKDIDDAVKWWSQIEIVGEKESNIAFLLFALSNKENINDSKTMEERIDRAEKDGYIVPDDL